MYSSLTKLHGIARLLKVGIFKGFRHFSDKKQKDWFIQPCFFKIEFLYFN